jgi:folate-binding protein YgfZ
MQAALLPDRGVIKVSGPEARALLDRLVTSSIETLQPGQARFAALLTPQGKIIVDFIVTEAGEPDGGGFFIDCPRALAAELSAKLTFYKLRAKATVENLSGGLSVMAVWDGNPGETENALRYPDPRLAAMGSRLALPGDAASSVAAELGATFVDEHAYETHRIALGVPRGGHDFVYGDAYPHETDMDQLGGVDFGKGCYVGQEVVSRVEHRATARARIVPVRYTEHSPLPGIPITAGDKNVGSLGSTADGNGLALLRLDRVEDAMKSGLPLQAGGIALTLKKPDWAKFRFPGEPENAA